MKSIQKIEQLFKQDSIQKLSESEINLFIELHWLEYCCRYDLSPCGDLTLTGKREYLENNIEIIQEMIYNFPIEETENTKSNRSES